MGVKAECVAVYNRCSSWPQYVHWDILIYVAIHDQIASTANIAAVGGMYLGPL